MTESARYNEGDVPNQRGKTVLVTGANTGIGFEVARVLAGRGGRVLMACRDRGRAQTAMRCIQQSHPDAELDFVALDLGNLSSVRHAAEVVAQETKLDLLINNAGIMMPPKTLTVNGFEAQFGVNHLGHFALTGLLLEKLMNTPGSRVVTVSSLAHRGGKIDYDDVHAESSYRKIPRYQMSKLANLLFMMELHRRLQAGHSDVCSVACHPGGAATELTRNLPKIVEWVSPLYRQILNSAAQGALPVLLAATGAKVCGGDYFGPTKFGELARSAQKVSTSKQARDVEDAARLWQLSIKLTGVTPPV